MKIEEAILYVEDVAENIRKEAERFKSLKDYPLSTSMQRTVIKCEKSAEEQRKIAEWLKALRDIKKIIDIDNSVIQEDVIKYKLICEIIERFNKEE